MAGSASFPPTERPTIDGSTSHGGPAILTTLATPTDPLTPSPLSDSEHEQLIAKGGQQCGMTDHIRRRIKQGTTIAEHSYYNHTNSVEPSAVPHSAAGADALLAAFCRAVFFLAAVSPLVAYFTYEMETCTYVLTPGEKYMFSQTNTSAHATVTQRTSPLPSASSLAPPSSYRLSVSLSHVVVCSLPLCGWGGACSDSVVVGIAAAATYFVVNHGTAWLR